MPRTKARQTKEIFIQNLRGGTPIHDISTFGDQRFKQYMWNQVRVTTIDQNNTPKYNHEIMKWHLYSHCFVDSLDGFKLEIMNCDQAKKGFYDFILHTNNRFANEIYRNIHSFLMPDYIKIL